MIEININDKVRFKLTERGRDILRNRHPGPSEGWLEWQFWEVMDVFGEAFATGGAAPFETIQVDLSGRADLNEVTRGPDDAVGFLREVLREVDTRADYRTTVERQSQGKSFSESAFQEARSAARNRLKKALVDLSKPPPAQSIDDASATVLSQLSAGHLRVFDTMQSWQQECAKHQFAREEIDLLKQHKANAEREIERLRAEIARLKRIEP